MRKTFLYSTFLILFCFLLASCNGSGKKSNKRNLTINKVDEILFNDEEFQEVPIDNPDAFCNTYMDVEPDFMLSVQVSSAYLSDANVKEDIIATKSDGDSVDLKYSFVNSANVTLVEVRAQDGYERGKAYTLSIENNDNLKFYQRDESIRTVIFSIKDEDSNDLATIDNYPTYSFDKVTHFEGYGDYNTYLYYDGSISEGVGDIVIFSNEAEKIYIKIKKIESEKGKTKIYYECPETSEIFTDMDLHVDHKEVDMEHDFILRDIESFANDILDSDYVLVHAYAIADKYGFTPAVDKFLDKATVNFSFKPNGSKFDLGLEIGLTHEFESKWRICLSFKFQWTKEYILSGDAELKTILGIPVGVSMNCSAACDEKFMFQFVVTMKSEKLNPGYVPDTPKDLDLSRAAREVQELKDTYVERGFLPKDRDKIVGDTMMINVGYITLRFGYLSIDIEVFACLKLTVSCTLGVCYTYSNHQVLVNYSTSSSGDSGRGGASDAGMSPSEVSASVLDFSIAGNFSVEAFAKLRISFYITGLKFLASIGVDGDAGVYLDAQGLGTGGYDFTADEAVGNVAASLEFGFFFRVTLNVDLLWIFHNSWELYSAKAPILKLGWASSLQSRSNNDVIELNKRVTNIDDTNLLVFTTFDGLSMSAFTKQYLYDARVTWLDSIFMSDPYDYPMFERITTDDPETIIKNGQIIINEDVAETSGQIVITHNFADKTTVKFYANFHYVSSEAKYVTFDGENREAYLPGQKIEFPITTHKDGYRFLGWEYNGKLINSMDFIQMGNEDISFKSRYILSDEHIVRFYDGFNNLISEQIVKTGLSAIEPSEALRDELMEDYIFVEWDRRFDSVNGDLEIHAIYEKVGEIL